MGHVFLHRLQSMHWSLSTTGLKKPSLSTAAVTHPVGQTDTQAWHPVHNSKSQISLVNLIEHLLNGSEQITSRKINDRRKSFVNESKVDRLIDKFYGILDVPRKTIRGARVAHETL